MKKTKHALLLSAVSVLLCLSVLVGSTFAWFTDTASTGVNKIVAGNLDMKVSYVTCSEGDDPVYAELTEDVNVFKTGTLWEPGHVEVVHLKVENIGSLAFKYNLGINIVDEKPSISVKTDAEFRLSDYIKYAVIEDEQEYNNSAEAIGAAVAANATEIKNHFAGEEKIIYAAGNVPADEPNGADAQTVTVIVYMPTDIGNEANYKTGEGIEAPEITLGITVNAAQYTYEEDSFDEQYDADAKLPVIVTTAEEAAEALKVEGASITVTDDIGILEIPAEAKNATVNFENANIDQVVVAEGAEDITFVNLNIDAESNYTSIVKLNGNHGTVTLKNAKLNNTTAHAIWGGSGTDGVTDLILENCEITNVGYAIYDAWYALNSLTIIDTKFKDYGSWPIMIQGTQKTGTDITIDNCTFIAGRKDRIAKLWINESSEFVFTNNKLIGCADSKPYGLFEVNKDFITDFSGNTMDGVAFDLSDLK